MATFGADRTLWATLGAVALAAIASPLAAGSQPATEPAQSYEEKLLAEIEEEESRNGPHSEELIGPLTELSKLYRQTDDRLAVVAADRALEVVRASRGLSSLDQAPLLRDLIDYDEASGDYASARYREHALLALERKHPDDLRTVEIDRAIADNRMNLLSRYVAGEYPPQILRGCDGTFPGYVTIASSCAHGSREAIAFSILQDAWTRYWRAIDLYREHGLYSSDELRDIELRIVTSAYRYCASRQSRTIASYREYCAEVGRRSYERLFYYATRTGRSADRVQAAVEIADWDLLFSPGYWPAPEIYAAAYAELKARTSDEPSIERLFSPPLPVVLPTFLPNPLASEEARSSGYIDVAFEIDRVGTSRHVKVLDRTANVSDDAARRLVRTIETSRFRPRVTNGELGRTSAVALRYFVRE